MVNISHKYQFSKLYEAGVFGNKLRSWGTIQELLDSGYMGFVNIRTRGVGGGGAAAYNLRVRDVRDYLKAHDLPESKTMANVPAPDHKLLWQGELWGTRYLFIDRTPGLNMRQAILRARKIEGAQAFWTLKSTLTPSSFSDLVALLEQYEPNVVELSVYSEPVGLIPGRNAIVWEVRNY